MNYTQVVRRRPRLLHWSKIAVVLLIGWGNVSTVLAQDTGTFTRFKNNYSTTLSIMIPAVQFAAEGFVIPLPFRTDKPVTPLASNLSPRIYNYQNLGIFCKLDVKLDGVTKWPVRFRLGTQEVVDRKEGKH